MNVLYLYSGSRKDTFKGSIGVDYPDTQFYGLNHLARFGISAEHKEWNDLTQSRFWDAVLDFRMKHLLLYSCIKNYDVVFGSSLLYLLPIKKLLRPKTKFVLLNIGLTRTLSNSRGIKYRLLAWILKELDGVVCLSSFQKEYLEEHFPFLRDKVSFVPLGVDTSFYAPVYENRKAYILSAGRDNGREYRTVVETARLMPHQEFHIVCSPRNLVGIENIPENVKVFYDLPISDLHKKYQEARLLLLVTRNDLKDGSDCSGQTILLDAMANGLPVIVNRQTYLDEYVIASEEAIIVDGNDPEKIKIAIESLHSVELRHAIAVRARQRVEKDFSTSRMAEKLADVFTRISHQNG